MILPAFNIDYRQVTMKAAHNIKRAAKRHLREVNEESEENREEFLLQECQQAALNKGTTIATQYTKRMNCELQRKMHRAITSALPSKRSKATDAIEVPRDWNNDNSICDTYSEKEDVEKWASYHIHRNFRQVYNTPTGQGIFREQFGLLANTPAADDVIAGTYVPPEEMDHHLGLMLQHLQRPESVEEFDPEVTMVEVKGACKSMREKTSSSPHGCHFGHFVAISEDDFLCQVLASIVSIPLITGLSPARFRQVTTCFLEKKANVKRIDKMRTIWLLDSFFSLTQRIMARRTYANAEKAGLLAIEDFGGRKGKDASMQAVNTRIMMDIALQQRRNTVITGIDYTNCFDRMSHAITCLKLRQVGHKKEPVICRYSTVQNLEVTIRTAHGDSPINTEFEVYVIPLNNPYQGSQQIDRDDPIGVRTADQTNKHFR